MKTKIYLDDLRTPESPDSAWVDNIPDWQIVRSYDEFVAHIRMHGLENYEVISLDHDLGEGAMVEYYTNTKPNYELDYNRIPEKTGMDCARFLVAESMNTKVPLPTIYVHSANPIGSANMMGYINNYFRNNKLPEVCIKVNIAHTYTEELTVEERQKRYNIMKNK